MTRIPAARAAFTPSGESSMTTASFALTRSFCSTLMYPSGSGFRSWTSFPETTALNQLMASNPSALMTRISNVSNCEVVHTPRRIPTDRASVISRPTPVRSDVPLSSSRRPNIRVFCRWTLTYRPSSSNRCLHSG